jgi:hypothetical protein
LVLLAARMSEGVEAKDGGVEAARDYFRFVAANWRRVAAAGGLRAAPGILAGLWRAWSEEPAAAAAFLCFRALMLQAAARQRPGAPAGLLEERIRGKWRGLEPRLRREFQRDDVA